MPVATLLMVLTLLPVLPAADPWLVEHPRPQAPRAISLKSLTDQVLAPMRQDGTADLVDLESMLKGIQADVASHLVLPDPSVVADASEKDPLTGNGWRLWTFWTMAEPELTGLVSALVRVRGSGLAAQRIIHLASLRQWEAMTFRCNAYRETMMAAAQAGDLQRSRGILAAWKGWLGETDLFLSQFHHQGIGVLSDPTAARALRIETTPCFRLISPRGRIHALDGFGPDFDLVAWISRCQAWEADYDHRNPGAHTVIRPVRGALLIMAAQLALRGTQASLSAEDRIVDDVIIVVDEPVDPAVPSAVPAESPPQAGGTWIPAEHGDIYRAVWRHPEQTFLDSEIGPLPLWTETVYDANGDPRPRFPDVFTKNFLDNPSETTALAYLESSRTRARRYLEASQIMQKTAIDHGFVTAEAFRPPKSGLSNDRALTPPYGFTADNWGAPVMTPQQARLTGLKPHEIPQTPGRTTTRQVEVLFFWDHRCQYSRHGFKDFAKFGTEIFNRELGPRIITVSMDNDSVTTRTQLDFLQYSGVETHYIENWLDQTELATSMNIRVTPTYVLLDRRTGRLLRYEGLKDEAFLRGALLELVGHKDAPWDDARPEWFRPTDPALDAARPRLADRAAGVPGESTPVQSPSRTLKAWDPDGQARH